MSEQVALYAEFTAVPGAADTVESLICEYAEVVRAEPGNRVFEVYRRREDADRFVVFEVYRDQAAFGEHLGGEAGAVFNAKLAPLIVEPHSELSFLSPVGSA